MKRIFKGLLLSLIIVSLSCSCFKRDDMEDIKIYTTVYPITYIISNLYGDYAEISSIYPNGVDVYNYELTDKQLNDYSNGDLFIYNGLSSEKDIARKLINRNKELKIIDVSYGLSIEYGEDNPCEIWLSPNNYLMLATTVKNNLIDFMSSTYMKEKINTNYKKIQEDVSLIDAELRSLASTAKQKNKNTLIVSSNVFKYLENYGFEVISLEDEKNYNSDVKNNFKNGTYTHVLIANDEKNDIVNELIKNYDAKTISINTMEVLSDDQVKDNENYINITRTFIKNLSDIIL